MDSCSSSSHTILECPFDRLIIVCSGQPCLSTDNNDTTQLKCSEALRFLSMLIARERYQHNMPPIKYDLSIVWVVGTDKITRLASAAASVLQEMRSSGKIKADQTGPSIRWCCKTGQVLYSWINMCVALWVIYSSRGRRVFDNVQLWHQVWLICSDLACQRGLSSYFIRGSSSASGKGNQMFHVPVLIVSLVGLGVELSWTMFE